MLHTQTPPPKQVLLRLPEDVASQLARAVRPRQRNRYIVELLRNDLLMKQKAESQLMAEAAERMNELEAQYPELAGESEEWVNAQLTEPVEVWDPDFDRDAFERDIAQAQAARETSSAAR